MPSENSVAVTLTSPIGDPRDFAVGVGTYGTSVQASIDAVTSEAKEEIDRTNFTVSEMQRRMDIVEQKLACLPAIVVEAFMKAFNDFKYSGQTLPLHVNIMSSSASGCPGQATINIDVSGKEVLDKIGEMLSGAVACNVNFSELDRMRARLTELEAEYAADIAKRKAVAEKLMQDYPKAKSPV